MSYIAKTLLYLRDPVEVSNPETGEIEQQERGYIHPGQPLDVDVGPDRIEIWLAIGAIESLAPPPPPSNLPMPDEPQAPDESPPARRRSRA